MAYTNTYNDIVNIATNLKHYNHCKCNEGKAKRAKGDGKGWQCCFRYRFFGKQI